MITDLSIVVPLFNEEESVRPLVAGIVSVSRTFEFAWELILVDDGSTDSTWEIIESLRTEIPQMRGIKLRCNVGQTAAMVAGFDHSLGKIIVTLDGDLQNDPVDIPELLKKLDEGYDIVSGWRKDRQDHWSRILPSRIANSLISRTTGVHLHDYGCSLKAYRAECIRNMHCYGEMHRFFPAMASMTGAKVTELPVRHHARRFGTSKYGFNRIFKVFSDIFAINLLIRFSAAPLKGFVLCSIPLFLLSFSLLIMCLLAWALDYTEGKMLFFSLGGGISLTGALFLVGLGVLGELAVSLTDLSHTRLISVTSRKTNWPQVYAEKYNESYNRKS